MVDAVVADADEIAADDGNSTFHCVKVDELRFARHRRLQRYIRALCYLPLPAAAALSARSLRK